MHYFALLLGPEPTEQPDAATETAIMRAYVEFHAAAGAPRWRCPHLGSLGGAHHRRTRRTNRH